MQSATCDELWNGKPYWKSVHQWTGTGVNHGYLWYDSSTILTGAARWVITATLGAIDVIRPRLYGPAGNQLCPPSGTWTAPGESAPGNTYTMSLTLGNSSGGDQPCTTTSTTTTSTTTSTTSAPSGCPYSTDIYAMKVFTTSDCPSGSTIFAFGSNSGAHPTYDPSNPVVIIGSLDPSIECEPFCAEYIAYTTATGVSYSAGQDFSLDQSTESAGYVILTGGSGSDHGGGPTYSDCQACADDCDYC